LVNNFSNLSIRVRRLLTSHGIATAEQIKQRYPLGLLGIRGFGYKALREVEAAFIPGQPHYIPPPGAPLPPECTCSLCWREYPKRPGDLPA
jgi:hypothetical protein